MKRLALALTVVALGACQKAEQQQPARQMQSSPDTSHMMTADTSHMMMADTAKHMMMADTAKHMMMADTAKKAAPMKKAGAKPKRSM